MGLESLKVLLVDDHPHIRTLLSELLRSIGIFQTFQAGDGLEAMRIVRDRTIDIIMTDLIMTPVDGIEFVRLLRSLPDNTSRLIPVIMITGHPTLSRINQARDAGVNEFLVKPITSRGVIERLQVIIDHPRPFVKTPTYFGPDRRRKVDPGYEGPFRRSSDAINQGTVDVTAPI